MACVYLKGGLKVNPLTTNPASYVGDDIGQVLGLLRRHPGRNAYTQHGSDKTTTEDRLARLTLQRQRRTVLVGTS